jgi:hypothetical protein
MPAVPPPASGTPTGNALTDAGAAGAALGAAGFSDIAQINAQIAAAASDCLWPPSGSVTIPFIPGLWSQTFQVPCLFTHSEARAIVGVGILGAGLIVMFAGLGFFAVAEAVPVAARLIGLKTGGKAAAAAAPEAAIVPAPT